MMTFGEIREFDFSPFYVRLRGRRVPLPLSAVRTVMMSGRIDATPYPCTLLRALPEGYVPLPYGVSLGGEALDLVLVSSRPIVEIRTLGIVKGYENVLHSLEGVLTAKFGLNLSEVRIEVFSTISPDVDAHILYGDTVLRGDYGPFTHTYNLAAAYSEVKGKPLSLAVWVVREELAEEVETRVGNSLAWWLLHREEMLLRYSEERKVPLDVLKRHAKALIFRTDGLPP